MKWHSGRHAGIQTLIAYCFGRAGSQKAVGPTLLVQVCPGFGCDKQISDYAISCLSRQQCFFFVTGCMGYHVLTAVASGLMLLLFLCLL